MGEFMHGLVPIVGVLLLFGGIPAIILTGVIMYLKNRRHKVEEHSKLISQMIEKSEGANIDFKAMAEMLNESESKKKTKQSVLKLLNTGVFLGVLGLFIRMFHRNIKKLNENATVPTYGSAYAAGADLYACESEDIVIAPSETKLIHTGIAMEIPEGLVGLIYARSGLASKKGLAPANKVGVVDADYRGEVMVALHNHGKEAQSIEPGERIAQMVIAPYITANFILSDSLDDTERGEGGFGSTGRK